MRTAPTLAQLQEFWRTCPRHRHRPLHQNGLWTRDKCAKVVQICGALVADPLHNGLLESFPTAPWEQIKVAQQVFTIWCQGATAGFLQQSLQLAGQSIDAVFACIARGGVAFGIDSAGLEV